MLLGNVDMVLLADFLVGSPSWVPIAVGAVVVIVVLTLLSYRRTPMTAGMKTVGVLLKILGVALLAVCLIEPLFSGVRPRPGANLFVVLTDNSQSMTVNSGSQVRGDTLKSMLRAEKSWRTRLQQDFDVRDYKFDAQLHHVEDSEAIEFDGTGSALHTALKTIQTRFDNRPVAGVIVLSDGNATDISELEKYEFPVFPIVDEDSEAIQDVSIRDMSVAQTNFEAAPITVQAVVTNQGFDAQDVTARIVNKEGKTLQEQKAKINKSKDHEFKFRFRPDESGLSFHRLEAFPTAAKATFESAKPGSELTLANNKRWMTVDRGGGPFRVLYVSGRPNWEFKFIRRALDEDDEIKLTGLIRIAKKQPKFTFQDRSGVSDRNTLFEGFDGKDDEDAEAYDQTVYIRIGVEDETQLADGFPKDSEELFKYHAIILDDIEAKFFTANQMLLMRRFVNQRGGGLMMLGGMESFAQGGYEKTPLGEVLPVYLRKVGQIEVDDEDTATHLDWEMTREGWLQDWTRLRVTEAAEKKRLNVSHGMYVLNRVSGLKPGAVLMAAVQSEREGKPMPVFATQRFGKGRSAALLAGDMWKWQMHATDPIQKDMQQLWRQIVRWMVAEVPKRVAVKSERTKGIAGPTSIQVSVQDEEFKPHDNAEAQVKVTSPTGEIVQLSAEASTEAAGLYAVDYWPHEEGPYKATAIVTTSDGEELDAKHAGWTSQPAADEFRELTTNRELLSKIAENSGGEMIEANRLDDFVSSLPNRKVPITEKWVYPVWHQWWVLSLAVCCLCAEWGLRRWRGLP